MQLETIYLGNSMQNYAIAIGVFIGFLIVFKIFQSIVLAHLKKLALKTKTDIDDALVEIVTTIKPPFYSFLAFYLALKFLAIATTFRQVISAILIIWIVYQVIAAIQVLINYIIEKKVGENNQGRKTALHALGVILKIILWTIGILLIFSNLGIDITSLIAGLGIGGIAVALALQNILGDLFSSFTIYLDKPFTIGDFIIVGDNMGVVEKIGIKTTRIRALQGEEIVISNQELTSVRIQNFKKMVARRVVFSFGVTYETPSEKLKKIPDIIREIIDKVDLARFDRAHFYKFADSSLDFEVVYYVATGDYNQYMDVHQDIHLQIKEALEREGIDFAYPTTSVYLQKN